MKLFALLLPAVLVFTGCSTLDSHFEPKANLVQLKHIYVVESLNDNHDLHDLIVRCLQSRGLQAESGPLTLLPFDVKAYVVYEDRWDWDFKNYLIGLTLTVREAPSDHLLASASYFRPTAFLKSPEFMVQTVLDQLLKPGAKSTPPRPEHPASEESGRRGNRGS